MLQLTNMIQLKHMFQSRRMFQSRQELEKLKKQDPRNDGAYTYELH